MLFCPICDERTPHAPRWAEVLVAIVSLLLLVSCAVLWMAYVDRVSGALVLVVAAALLGRGVAARFRILACTVCGERRLGGPRDRRDS